MRNFDKIIYQWRFLIGGVLVVIILMGSGFLIWQKVNQNRQNESSQIESLKQQNDLLRQELSGQNKQVAGASDQPESTGDKINLNMATVEQLDTLPGIGPAYATAIITYREQHAFKTIEEIKDIKGIGDKTFEKLVNLITVGE